MTAGEDGTMSSYFNSGSILKVFGNEQQDSAFAEPTRKYAANSSGNSMSVCDFFLNETVCMITIAQLQEMQVNFFASWTYFALDCH